MEDCFPCTAPTAPGAEPPISNCDPVCPDPIPAWATKLVPFLRVCINDVVCPYDFEDCRLIEIFKLAAFQLIGSLCGCSALSGVKIIDENCDIIIDPMECPVIANLLVLKAACIIDKGLVRAASIQESVKAVCGPASLQVTNSGSLLTALLSNGACSAFDTMLENCCFRDPLQTAQNAKFILNAFGSCPKPTNIDDCCSTGSGRRAGGDCGCGYDI